MRILKIALFYFVGIIGIICISVFPQYIESLTLGDSSSYYKQLTTFLLSLRNSETWSYETMFSPNSSPIVDVLYEPFLYSLKILFGAFSFGLLLALLLAVLIQFLNKSIPAIKSMLDFLESIPDLILATLLQMFSIYIFKKTGISFFAVAAYQEPIYFAPIVTLSILPAISMCKILTHLIEEESLKQYVLFVKGKGIRKIVVLVKHILRNIFPDFSHRLKLIIWGMLSSQFIIERIFNVQGLTFYLVESFTPITIFTALFLIFTPFYLLFSILDFIVEKDQYESNPIQGVCRRKKSGVKAVVINGIDNLHVTFRQQFRHFIKMIKRKSCFLKDCFLKENFLLLKQGGDSCGRSTSRRPCRSEFEQRATKRLRPCPRKASALVNNNKVFENGSPSNVGVVKKSGHPYPICRPIPLY